jgi:ABC transporter substrate binding protein
MYPFVSFSRAGGLMSYTADPSETDRLLGYQYVGRLLRGIKPFDLPVQQPTKFRLILNLSAAKDIGIEIPPTLQAIADEVDEMLSLHSVQVSAFTATAMQRITPPVIKSSPRLRYPVAGTAGRCARATSGPQGCASECRDEVLPSHLRPPEICG